jgi:transposase InsO family protein
MTFAGSCNRDLFEMWLEDCLLPKLQPGDVIVIDNASFHRSQAIEEIVAQAGCELWYLPPYSPDLNQIEHWWFVLKNWMRQRWDEFRAFEIALMLPSNFVLIRLSSAIVVGFAAGLSIDFPFALKHHDALKPVPLWLLH